VILKFLRRINTFLGLFKYWFSRLYNSYLAIILSLNKDHVRTILVYCPPGRSAQFLGGIYQLQNMGFEMFCPPLPDSNITAMDNINEG
jgi:hypothetical protein